MWYAAIWLASVRLIGESSPIGSISSIRHGSLALRPMKQTFTFWMESSNGPETRMKLNARR
jgi:hypothetical protein